VSERAVAGTLVLRPSAKINLTLRVGPRRRDGFHDVQTLLQSIDLHDTLRLTSHEGAFALASNSSGIPVDETNLVWRAADLLWRALGRSAAARDVRVAIEKSIPTAAGLGGGSADAAAALVGLNQIWDGGLTRAELMRVAADLGSDVPFFLQGGTAFGTGRGDELYPVDDLTPLSVLILKPPIGVSTPDAYRWLDEDRLEGQTVDRPRRDVVTGWPMSRLAIANDLEAPVIRRHPEIAAGILALEGTGAIAAAMSGSGSAIFGLFPSGTARNAAKQLKRPGWLVLPSRTLSRRAAGRRMGL
jgi:4-diphosphocytidyl-2-C-methyl-D-erythritol kinase